jgi:inositol transporter-like SP family MFS transporter
VTEKIKVPAPAWGRAIIAGMASYLDAAAIVSTSTALVLYQGPLGLDGAAIGILSSVLTFSIAVGAIVGGALGDRFGRRRVFTVTMIMLVIGAVILAFAAAPAMLYIGVILLGFAAGADLPVSLALIAEEAPEGARGKLVAFSQVLWFVGILVTIVLSIFVGGFGDLGGRILYGHVALVGLIVLVLRFRLPESKLWTETHAIAVHAAPAERARLSGLRQLLTRPYLTSFIGLAVFYALSNIAANTTGQFGTYMYVNVAGVDVPTASAISLIALVLGVALAFVFTRLVDGPRRGVWYLVGAVSMLLSLAVPALFGVTFATLVASGLFGAVGTALAFEGIFKVWAQELFPTLLRATAQGTIIAFARVVAAIVAIWTPLLLGLDPRMFFSILFILVAVAMVAGYFTGRNSRQKAAGTFAEPPVTAQSN